MIQYSYFKRFASCAYNRSVSHFRELVEEELSRDGLEERDTGAKRENEEDIFISDSEEGKSGREKFNSVHVFSYKIRHLAVFLKFL